MKEDIDSGSGIAQQTARESGHGDAFGSRIRALVEIGSRALQSEADPRFGRAPGLRTRIGRRYGPNVDLPPRSDGWSAQALSILRGHPLHGIAAATVAGIITGLLVWTLINRRR